MEKRFGARDIVLYLFMAIILISIWLAMFQIDRQWQFIADTQEKIDDQTRDIADLKRQLRTGAFVAGGQTANGSEDWRGFDRAVAATERPDYATGDWLIDSFGSSVPTLTPMVSGDAYSSRVQWWVFDSLSTRDPETLEWLPLVAESWVESEDGLSITFKIRRGVTFSDGEPLTAQDVAFTYRFVMDERIAAPRARSYYAQIESVEAEGEEVTFRFREPYFQSFAIASQMAILPEHFYGRFLESVAAAEEFNTSTDLILGSGPYKLSADWKPGDAIELVRNDRYWGLVPPPFERRIYKTIQSDAARLTEFKNGGIDIYAARPLEYRGLVDDPAIQDRLNHYSYFNPRGGYTFIAWNNLREGKPTMFADRRVREAMTYLTDKRRIAEEIFLGFAAPANGPFNPLGRQHDPDLPLREYDEEKAKALLREAGFEDRDGDGVLESPTGEPFKFALTYPAESDDYKRIMLLLKDLFVRAGVLMEPRPVDWPILIEALDKKNFDAISLGWTSNFEIDMYQNMHSSQTGPGGDNFISFVSPELDAVIEAARAELNEEARMALWREAHRIVWREQPYTYLFRQKSLVFVDKRIQNVEVVRAGINSGGLWSMPMEWYVPAGDQRYIQ